MRSFTELTLTQAKVEIDLLQTFDAYQQAVLKAKSYAGGMVWKVQNNAEYLIRIKGRMGNSKSLGRRSPETEAKHHDFYVEKTKITERVASLKAALSDQSSMARVLKLGRIPALVANVLRAVDNEGLLERNLMVIGTNALYAYESAAGVRFDTELMATTDVDFLWDARSRLVFADPTGDFAQGGLLSLLKIVDPTFEKLQNLPYRAVNSTGFFVDLVKATPNPPWKRGEPTRMAVNDLIPAEIAELKWLLSSEKFTSTVVDQRGSPVRIICPDPRAFALYKAWLSQQVRREPIKRQRDLLQSQAVTEMLSTHLTHLHFTDEQLQMFPATILNSAREAMSSAQHPRPRA